MPLSPGSSQKTVSNNIAEMVKAGHPQDQAVAASLANARRTKRGGGTMDTKRDRKGHRGGRHSKRK